MMTRRERRAESKHGERVQTIRRREERKMSKGNTMGYDKRREMRSANLKRRGELQDEREKGKETLKRE
jgi:hypothetical protein